MNAPPNGNTRRLPRAARLPDPADAAAPKYWMWETSGALQSAVHLYLNERERVTPNILAYLRAYVMQWVDSPAWDQNTRADAAYRRTLADLRLDARVIATIEALDNWLARAIAFGIDPL